MIRTEVARELQILDQFNLEVARFRAKYGFSTSMVNLYGKMGRLCQELMNIERHIVRIEALQEEAARSFQRMKDKKGSI